MWHKPNGDGIIEGTYKTMFFGGVMSVLEDLYDDPQGWEYGIPVFDHLTAEQKIYMLLEVTKALTDPNIPIPELTAVNESTIAAVFAALKKQIHFEIANQDDRPKKWKYLFRKIVFDAIEFEEDDDGEEPIYPHSPQEEDIKKWDFLIDCISEELLWDDDFQMTWLEDAPPSTYEKIDDLAAFGEGYFSTLAPDPKPEEFKKVLKELFILLGKKVTKDYTKGYIYA